MAPTTPSRLSIASTRSVNKGCKPDDSDTSGVSITVGECETVPLLLVSSSSVYCCVCLGCFVSITSLFPFEPIQDHEWDELFEHRGREQGLSSSPTTNIGRELLNFEQLTTPRGMDTSR